MRYIEIARHAIGTTYKKRPTPHEVSILEDREQCAVRDQVEPLEVTLKGRAIELWSNATGERLWLVADDEDAVAPLGQPCGTVYTAAEARRITRIADPEIVAELDRWKRAMNGIISEHQKQLRF